MSDLNTTKVSGQQLRREMVNLDWRRVASLSGFSG